MIIIISNNLIITGHPCDVYAAKINKLIKPSDFRLVNFIQIHLKRITVCNL